MNKSKLFEFCILFISLSMFSSLDGGRIICLQQKFVFKVIKLKARAKVDAEWAKRKVSGTSQRLQKLGNSDTASEDPEISEQKQNKVILPRVMGHEEYGQESCEGPTHDDASVSEPESELKSWEGSSDEDETVYLRKLEAEAGASNEMQEMPHNSDTDVTEQQMKHNKRRMHVEGDTEECEASCNKRKRTEAQNVPGDVGHEGGCNSGAETLTQSEGPGVGQAKRLSLSAGFVWDADPSLLPAATAAPKSDGSSDEEEVSQVEDCYLNCIGCCLTAVSVCKPYLLCCATVWRMYVAQLVKCFIVSVLLTSPPSQRPMDMKIMQCLCLLMKYGICTKMHGSDIFFFTMFIRTVYVI
jgi:hypothetical protein